MIRLTRLRQTDPLYINPDHIERLDHHHDTVVRLLNGAEYVVVESPEEILEQVTMLRARVIATAARMVSQAGDVAAMDLSGVQVAAATPSLPLVVHDADDDGSADTSANGGV